VLKVVGGTKAFDEHVIFQNLNLTFHSNRIYALSGPSGSGKSTLLNCIAKLEKLDDGMISFQSKDVNQIESREYFHDYIGYLFQNYALIDDTTVKTNLSLTKRYRVEQLKLALREFGLDPAYLSRKVFTLSGGECQRVALARMFLKDPPIVLADEPTGALDRENEELVLSSLENFSKRGKIVIVATHSQRVLNRADEVVHINQL